MLLKKSGRRGPYLLKTDKLLSGTGGGTKLGKEKLPSGPVKLRSLTGDEGLAGSSTQTLVPSGAGDPSAFSTRPRTDPR